MRLAVLGSPVGHSLSPVMHQAALDAAGLSGSYVAIEVDRAGFLSQLTALRKGDLDGANVTMPHKRLAFESCDVLSSDSKRAGAANTLAVVDSQLVGENTDVVGIRSAWAWAELPDDAPVNILGSGGAASAALVALEGRDLRVSARRSTAVHDMVERTGVAATPVPWGAEMGPGVLVNATPIGMRGDDLPEYLLKSPVGLFDMAYGDQTTPAVVDLTARGLPVAAGLDMLIGQAAASFRIWTGLDADPAVMRIAADRELLRRKGHPR